MQINPAFPPYTHTPSPNSRLKLFYTQSEKQKRVKYKSTLGRVVDATDNTPREPPPLTPHPHDSSAPPPARLNRVHYANTDMREGWGRGSPLGDTNEFTKTTNAKLQPSGASARRDSNENTKCKKNTKKSMHPLSLSLSRQPTEEGGVGRGQAGGRAGRKVHVIPRHQSHPPLSHETSAAKLIEPIAFVRGVTSNQSNQMPSHKAPPVTNQIKPITLIRGVTHNQSHKSPSSGGSPLHRSTELLSSEG